MKSNELLNDSSSAEKSIIKARAQLIMDEPFFGLLALKLELKEDKSCKSSWTDGEVFAYNPEFIEKCSVTEVKTLLSKQVLAISLGHAWRLEHRETSKWQKASDIATLWVLKKHGFLIPACISLSTEHEKSSAEEIYAFLKDESDSPSSKSDQNLSEETSDSESKEEDAASFGELKSPSNPDKIKKLKDNWDLSCNQFETYGSSPGVLTSHLKNKTYTREQLFEVISSFLENSSNGLVDYDDTQPDAMYLLNDLFVPSLTGKSIKGVVFVRDSSGSIGNSYLEMFNSVILEVKESFNIENLTVLDCDTAIRKILVDDEISDESLSSIEGRGGTDFRPPFEWIENNQKEVTCLIYLTDLAGSFPPKESVPCLWTVPENWMKNQKAPFGQCVSISL